MDYLQAVFLGIVEGLTEFLPVSSTGHLILFVDLLGFEGPPGHVFEIVIQLGAILAVMTIFAQKIVDILRTLPTRKETQRFVLALLAAVAPAMVVGAIFHQVIKTFLFNPVTVAIALILGGIAIFAIERAVRAPRVMRMEDIDLRTGFLIGIFQCVAMIPGVSRAGATIMGALMLGVERRAAAEFSFFLAMPTIAAATVFDLYQNWGSISLDEFGLIAAGFFAAFVSALVVIRPFIAFVGRHGFAAFAWYRIVVGLVILALVGIAA